MSEFKQVEQALQLLREADASRGASRAVELALLEHRSFEHRTLKPRRTWLLAWSAVTVAATLLFIAVPRPAPEIGRPALALTQPATPSNWDRKVVWPAQVAQRQPTEVVTEFFPLLDVAPPMYRGQIVRTTVPAREMMRVGLPVRAERFNEPVTADIVFGEEGMAHAIRFVAFQQ